MTCIVCGRKMVGRTEYVQVANEHQLRPRDFFWCPCCKTRSAGKFLHEEAVLSRLRKVIA